MKILFFDRVKINSRQVYYISDRKKMAKSEIIILFEIKVVRFNYE